MTGRLPPWTGLAGAVVLAAFVVVALGGGDEERVPVEPSYAPTRHDLERSDRAPGGAVPGTGGEVEDVDAMLLAVARRGDADALVHWLSRGATPWAAGHDGTTALMLAVESGDTASVETLIAAGADSDVVHPQTGETALVMAIRSSAKGVALALVEAGADPDLGTPLILALWSPNPTNQEIARALLRAGADPNVKAASGPTPLGLAHRSGDPSLVELLTLYGAEE